MRNWPSIFHFRFSWPPQRPKRSKLVALAIFFCIATLASFLFLTRKEGVTIQTEAQQRASRLPIRNFAWWSKIHFRSDRLTDRILPAPLELLEHLELTYKARGASTRPSRFELSPHDLDFVRGVLERIPSSLRNAPLMPMAIFFVRNLGSSGWSESIVDSKGREVAGYIVIDESVLKARANDWATWRENLPFAKGPISIDVKLSDDQAEPALTYVLLHELGHMITLRSNHRMLLKVLRKSWVEPEEVKSVSRFESEMPLRGKLRFYSEPKLPNSNVPVVYLGLEKTNFPTLYSSTRHNEDIAESIANYVWTEILKKPFVVTIKKGDETLSSYGACWREARCETKRNWIKSLEGLVE